MSSIRGCSQGGCRASPIRDRCGWPAVSAPSRAWSATARKSIASGFRVDDALARIEALYKPYHRALRRLINKAHQAFGTVVVVDCHSMPSIGVSRDEPRRPDVVIGDRYGTSCARAAARHGRGDHEPARLFGRTQQALCRRLHHRALRQSGQRTAHHPARTQPRDLHGRAAARTQRRASRRWPRISPRWPTRWPPLPLGDLGPFQAAAE